MSDRVGQRCERWKFGGNVWRLLVVAAALVSAGAAGVGQGGVAAVDSINYWVLPRQTMEEMLLKVPGTEDERFEKLREYFAELHCTPELMVIRVLNKHKGKNIFCVLPGKDAEQIVVAARYDVRGKVDGVRQGWSEAAVLPILYNALRSQKREHTFVFVALCGYEGEQDFLKSIKKHKRPAPKVMVPLDSFALAAPWFMGKDVVSKEQAEVYDLLMGDAIYTRDLQHIGTLGWGLVPESQIEMVRDWSDCAPTLLITTGVKSVEPPTPLGHVDFNNPDTVRQRVSIEAFERDFEFVAYFLSKVDISVARLEAGLHERREPEPVVAVPMRRRGAVPASGSRQAPASGSGAAPASTGP